MTTAEIEKFERERRARVEETIARFEALGRQLPPEHLAALRGELAVPNATWSTGDGDQQHSFSTGSGHTVGWSEDEIPPDPVAMIPVVQLFRADAGDLAFPQGTDLLQILWCPNTHLGWRGPRPVAVWRNSADVADTLDAAPSPTLVTRTEYVPRPCVAHPEPLIDLPPICTLDEIDEIDDTDDLLGQVPAELEQRLRRWDADQPENEGYYYIAHAPGWKIGGWDGSWPDAAHIENCHCGAPMRPLLEVDRGEWLSGTWSPNQEPDFDWGDPARWQDQEPTGVNIGRNGMYWAHACTADVNHPLTHSLE